VVEADGLIEVEVDVLLQGEQAEEEIGGRM